MLALRWILGCLLYTSNAARTEQDVRTILRNRKPELFEMGLDAFKKAFTDLDTDSSWLKEQIEIPKEHQDAFTSSVSYTHLDVYKRQVRH